MRILPVLAVVAIGVAFASRAQAQVIVQTAPPAYAPPVQPVYTQQPVYSQPVYVQPVYSQPVYGRPVFARRRSGGGLIGAGAGILGAFWFASALTGLIQIGLGGDNNPSNCPGSGGCSSLAAEGYLNLIPVGGPWINAVRVMSSHDPWAGTIGVLYLLDGLIQAGGLTMVIIGGVVRSHDRIVRTHPRGPEWALLPFASPNAAGLTLSMAHF